MGQIEKKKCYFLGMLVFYDLLNIVIINRMGICMYKLCIISAYKKEPTAIKYN